METPDFTYTPATRILFVSDAFPPDDLTAAVHYALFSYSYDGAAPVILAFSNIGAQSMSVKVPDASYKLVLVYNEETPETWSVDYADDASPVFRVLANGDLLQARRKLYVSHAGSPHPLGQPYRAYLKKFSRAYEVISGYSEGNYLLAQQLLTLP